MTCFRRGLVLFLIVLASMSTIRFIRSEADAGAENGIAQSRVASVSSFPSVLEGA